MVSRSPKHIIEGGVRQNGEYRTDRMLRKDSYCLVYISSFEGKDLDICNRPAHHKASIYDQLAMVKALVRTGILYGVSQPYNEEKSTNRSII